MRLLTMVVDKLFLRVDDNCVFLCTFVDVLMAWFVCD